jgi:TM2 domain-containing membrane protein YozV
MTLTNGNGLLYILSCIQIWPLINQLYDLVKRQIDENNQNIKQIDELFHYNTPPKKGIRVSSAINVYVV